jgi:hypothetical protein
VAFADRFFGFSDLATGSIDQRQFRWLLEGLSIEQKSAQQKLAFTQV